jgi:hypothetical protein
VQILKDKVVEFDDRKVLQNFLEAHKAVNRI